MRQLKLIVIDPTTAQVMSRNGKPVRQTAWAYHMGFLEPTYPVPCTLEHALWQDHCTWMLDNFLHGYVPRMPVNRRA